MSSKLSSTFKRNLTARTTLIGIAALSLVTAARTASAHSWYSCPTGVCGGSPKTLGAPTTAPITSGSSTTNQIVIAPVYTGTGCTHGGSNTYGCWTISALSSTMSGSNYQFVTYNNSSSTNTWKTHSRYLLGLFDSTDPSGTSNSLYGWGASGSIFWWDSSIDTWYNLLGAEEYNSYVPDLANDDGGGEFSWATAPQIGTSCGGTGYPYGLCLDQYVSSSGTWSAMNDNSSCGTTLAGGEQITANRESSSQFLIDSSGAIWGAEGWNGASCGNGDYDTFSTTSKTMCGTGVWPTNGMVQIAATGSTWGNTKLFALSNTSSHGTKVWTSWFSSGPPQTQGCWTDIGVPYTGATITSIATSSGASSSPILLFGVDTMGAIYVWI